MKRTADHRSDEQRLRCAAKYLGVKQAVDAGVPHRDVGRQFKISRVRVYNIISSWPRLSGDYRTEIAMLSGDAEP